MPISAEHKARKDASGSIPRIDAHRYVNGKPVYTADLLPLGCLHVALLRSPHPRAHIMRIDLTRAKAAPDVVAVVTATDLSDMAPIPAALPFRGDVQGRGAIMGRCLAGDEVCYIGQPVVAVVAGSVHAAQAALGLFDVEYQPCPALLDFHEAQDEGTVAAHPGWTTNVVASDEIGRGDFDEACRMADVVVCGELDFAPSTTAPMEPCSFTGTWDASLERVSLIGTLQNPHTTRWMIATALRMPEAAVRVVAPPLGGSFGLKMAGHPEEVLVCALARHLKRPVNFTEERWETLLAPCRRQTHSFQIAATRDGRILGFADRFVADVGITGPGNGWSMPLVTAAVFPTVYDVEHCRVSATLVATNSMPWQPIRGYGKEIGNAVMERAVDLLAARLALDPIALRRKNLISADAFPVKLASGLNLDSGDYATALKALIELFGYDAWRARQAEKKHSDKVIGIGIAFELTPEGGARPGAFPSGFETATVKLMPGGGVQVLVGVTSPGSGNETGIAQLVAAELGVDVKSIQVVQGDTDVTPVGTGHASSRAMLYGGTAAVLAARDLRAKILICAANILNRPIEGLHIEAGVIVDAGVRPQALTIVDVAHQAHTNPIVVAKGTELPLEATRSFQPINVSVVPDEKGRIATYSSFPYSVHAAAIELDRCTGSVKILDYACVHDCGVMINPMLVTGQLKGAIVMGIGAALWEELTYDAAGRPLSRRFKEYLLPRAIDLPDIRVGHMSTPSPYHPLGLKGAGESGVGGGLAVMLSAVADALGERRDALTRCPATPPTLLDAMA